MMKRSRGSSLVDLMSTMTILGVMVTTVTPAYVDLRGFARSRVIGDLLGKASYEAEASRLYFIAKGGDATSSSASMTINGHSVNFKYGYPSDQAGGLSSLVSFGGVLSFPGVGGPYTLWEVANSVTNCYVRYYAPTAVGSAATILTDQSGC